MPNQEDFLDKIKDAPIYSIRDLVKIKDILDTAKMLFMQAILLKRIENKCIFGVIKN